MDFVQKHFMKNVMTKGQLWPLSKYKGEKIKKKFLLHIPKFLGNHKGAFCIYDKCDESLEKTDQPNWSNMNQSSYKAGKLSS